MLVWLFSLALHASNAQPVAGQAFTPDGQVRHYTVEHASTAIAIDGGMTAGKFVHNFAELVGDLGN